MSLVFNERGEGVPLSRVRRIDERFNQAEVQLRLDDDSAFYVSKEAWARARQGWIAATLPAQPGTCLLVPMSSDDAGGGEPFSEGPVLGWAVTMDGEALPIGVNGVEQDESRVILHPDGRVEENQGGSWPSLQSYRAYLDKAAG